MPRAGAGGNWDFCGGGWGKLQTSKIKIQGIFKLKPSNYDGGAGWICGQFKPVTDRRSGGFSQTTKKVKDFYCTAGQIC
jgi:hypothetical protein